MLRGLVAAIDGGRFHSVSAVAHADSFTDLLDQAEARASVEAESVSAVMIAGGVLEAHLRYLGTRRAISVEMSAIGKWNVKLHEAGLYGRPLHRQIESWASLRNDADHLKVTTVEKSIVKGMLAGVRALLVDYPE